MGVARMTALGKSGLDFTKGNYCADTRREYAVTQTIWMWCV
jgi:hypothetical protein